MAVSERLAAEVTRAFAPGTAERVLAELDTMREVRGAGVERLQSAVVILAWGDWDRFVHYRHVAVALDWRDVLMDSGLAHADWPEVLDRVLGPAPEPGSAP